jgi:hypothetical protein
MVTLTFPLSLVPLKIAALSGVVAVSMVICSDSTPISAKISSRIAGPRTLEYFILMDRQNS